MNWHFAIARMLTWIVIRHVGLALDQPRHLRLFLALLLRLVVGERVLSVGEFNARVLLKRCEVIIPVEFGARLLSVIISRVLESCIQKRCEFLISRSLLDAFLR